MDSGGTETVRVGKSATPTLTKSAMRGVTATLMLGKFLRAVLRRSSNAPRIPLRFSSTACQSVASSRRA